MAAELGAARISVGLDTSKVAGEIKRAFSGVDAEGSAAGKSAGGGFASGFKSLVGPALALAGGALFGGVIAEAARASDATDKFKATMNFAGLDTSAIDAAAAATKEYADQTVYDLPTIQNTLAQLASNGVKDYTGLTKAAGNLNAVAGGNADTFKSVAMVMTQTAGAGKLTTENWNQMADAIPGAAGPLMKALEEAGAYTGNFRDAMAAGEVSADEFNDALMKLGNDPIAVEAAKSTATFEGAIGNLQATINSGLMSALNALKPAITGAITGVSNGIGKIFSVVGGTLTGLKSLIMDGDITPTLLNALGVEEDSPVIAGLMWVQEKIWAAFRGIQDFMAGFSVPMPDIAAQLEGSLGGLFTFGLRAKELVMKAYFGVSDFILGFTMPKSEILPQEFAGLIEVGNKVRGVFDQIGPILAPLVGQFVALASAVSPTGTVFQALMPMMPQLLDMFSQLAVVVGQSLSQAITSLLPIFVQLQSVVIAVFQQVLTTALPVVVQLVTMLGQTFAQLLPIIMPIITSLADMAMTLVSQLMPIFMQLVSTVLPMVVTIFGAVLEAIGPLISMIAGLLIPIIQALMPVVVAVFSVVADVIKSAMQIVQGIIQVVTGIISGDWDKVWNGIQNIFKGVWNTIVALVRGALQIIGQVVISGLGLVGNFVGSTLSSIGRFFADTWNNVVNGVSSMIGNVVGFFSGLIGRITGAIGNAGSALFSVGVNIIQGLINGIGSMMGAIGRAVINIVPEAIRGPFESLLGIHSPSRVFIGYGVNIGQGLINGIGAMHGRIESAVTGMVSVPPVPVLSSPAYSPAGVGGSTGLPSSLRLVVDGHEFTAYVDNRASGVVQGFDSSSQYRRVGRN